MGACRYLIKEPCAFFGALATMLPSTTKPGAGTCLARGGGVRMRCGGCLCANRTAAGSVREPLVRLAHSCAGQKAFKNALTPSRNGQPHFCRRRGLSAALRPRSWSAGGEDDVHSGRGFRKTRDTIRFGRNQEMDEHNLTLAQIEAFRGHLLAEERAPGTVEKYQRDLRAFLRWLDGEPSPRNGPQSGRRSCSRRAMRQ